MTSQLRPNGVAGIPIKLVLKGFVFALCCVADLFVLRIIWARRDIAEGQFRRGYFEEIGGEVGLAMDNKVRPDTLPRFLLTTGGELGVPPGMTAIMPLTPGERYAVGSDSMRAAYVVIGTEAPVPPASSNVEPAPGEARLLGARTLALQDGRLALAPWDPTRPWRDDAARLAAIRQSCADDGDLLTIDVAEDRVDIRLGHCSLAEALRSSPVASPLLAVPAGAEWATVARAPDWAVERSILWPAFALVTVKELLMWAGLGLTSAAAVSAALALAALVAPVEAALTWPLALIIAVVTAALRAMAMVLRRLPGWARVPAVLAAVTLIVVWAVVLGTSQPRIWQRIMRTHGSGDTRDDGQPDACALIGYSTVKGEALRDDRSGIRWLLDESCPRCRGKTAALFASGETLAWVRDAYCASPSSFGVEQVIFLGGANDDFLSAVSSPSGGVAMARAFIEPGVEPWRRGYEAAAAASLARIDEQVAAIEGLLRCIHARGSQFLFLHDFMVGDMTAGRQSDRTTMLVGRRAAVEAGGGRFIDLLEQFGAEAGVSWFNDAVHLSLIGHRRVSELTCDQRP